MSKGKLRAPNKRELRVRKGKIFMKKGIMELINKNEVKKYKEKKNK